MVRKESILLLMIIAIVILLYSCKSEETPPAPDPTGTGGSSELNKHSDFSFTTVEGVKIAQDQRATIAVIVEKDDPQKTLPGALQLSVSGSSLLSQDEASGKIAYEIHNAEYGFIMTYKVGKGVPAGSYNLTVKGKAGALVHKADFKLTVTETNKAGSKPGTYKQDGNARLLFSSAFEQPVSLTENGELRLQGSDVPGYAWSDLESMFGALDTYLQRIGDASDFDYQLQQSIGWDGSPTRSLFMGFSGGQTWLYLTRRQETQATPMAETIYFRYRLKWPADLEQLIRKQAANRDGYGWHNFMFTKSPGQHPLEHRIEPGIRWTQGQNNEEMYWSVSADHGESPFQKFWEITNTDVPVPAGQWFTVEVYWYRSTGSDGRYYLAVDGHTIVDYYGRTKNNLNIQRIGFFGLYGAKMYQWVDDFQIWDDIPCSGLPCVVSPSQ